MSPLTEEVYAWLRNPLRTVRATCSAREVLLVGIELSERTTATVSQMARGSGIPTTTVWKMVHRLLELEYVESAEAPGPGAEVEDVRSDAEWFRLTASGLQYMRDLVREAQHDMKALAGRFSAADDGTRASTPRTASAANRSTHEQQGTAGRR